MAILASDGQDFVNDLCRRFTQATGARLTYVPEGSRPHLPAPGEWSAPIDDGASVVGRLALELDELAGLPLSPNELAPLRELATGLADLLGRLRSTTKALELRTQEVSTLVNLGSHQRRGHNVAEGLAQMLRAAVELTGYWSAAFYLLDPSTQRLRLRAAYQFERNRLPPLLHDLAVSRPDRDAMTTGPVFLQRESRQDELWLAPGMNCAVCLAVQSEAAPIGTLWVYDRRMHAFSSHDVHILSAITNQLATFLERVVLLRENEMQHRLASDVRVASESHTGSMVPRLERDRGLEAASRCVSRHELGGDLCELIPLRDGRTAVALGDASGNSIPAALVMSAVRGALRIFPGSKDAAEMHPAKTMEQLNDALHSITSAHQFMSLFHGIYDPALHRLTYCNAGHPPPILFRKGQAFELEAHGMLLGVVPDMPYEYSVMELEPGDLVVIYSDGISEAMNADQQLFKTQGIIDAVRKSSSDSPADVLQSVWTHAERHASDGDQLDDRTLLVLRFH